MLRIITGRISSGKTEKIINMIGKRIANKQKSVLIVPDQVTYNFEQRLCSQLHLNGFIDASVSSFNRFASDILAYTGNGGKVFLDDCGKAMVMRCCISRAQEDLTVFKAAAKKKGFTQRCLKTVSTIQNCGYSANDLLLTANKLNESILKQKLTDMSKIYGEYSKILESGYTDNSDRLLSAAQALENYSPIKEAHVFIDGFDVFTSRLYQFIRSIAMQTDVTIAVSSSMGAPDSDAYEIHLQTLKTLIKMAKESGIKIIMDPCRDVDTEKCAEMLFLQDNFFAPNPKTFSALPAIDASFHKTPYDEVNYTALKISTLVCSGARYRDICVLCGNVESYSPLISSVFDRFEIPVYTDKKINLLNHPAAMYLFSALKCAMYGFSAENVCGYLMSYLSPIEQSSVDFFITFMNTMGISSEELENGLYFSRTDDDKQAEFEILRRKVVGPLKDLRFNMLNSSSAKEKSACCYNFLNDQGVYQRIDELISTYENSGFYRLSDASAQVWNTIMRLLEDIASLLGEKKISLKEFYDTLFEGFSASPAATIPSTLDSVTFGALNTQKEKSPLYTFILGVNAGVIPAVYTDDRLVTPEEGVILINNGLELAHSAQTEDARIRYNIYSAFTSPKKRLFLSYTAVNQSGNSMKRSHIFGKLCRIFPKFSIVTVAPPSPEEMLAFPVTKKQVLLALALEKVSSNQAKALLSELESTQEKECRIISAGLAKDTPCIPPSLAMKLFSPQKAVSISRLEDFAQCPFSHFIKNGLLYQNREEYAATSIDIGNLFHSVLEDFVKETSPGATTAECIASAEKIFDKKLPQVHYGVFMSSYRQKTLNASLKSLIVQCACQINGQLDKFKPADSELSFGYGKNPPLKISTEYGELTLRGKIDRVDTMSDEKNVYIRIVDYKSGNHTFKKSNVENGTDIQLLMYMNVMLSRAKETLKPAAAIYMPLVTDDSGNLEQPTGVVSNTIDKNGVSEEEFNFLLNTAKESAKKSAEGILSGAILPKHEKSQCEVCRYGVVCRQTSFSGGEENEVD